MQRKLDERVCDKCKASAQQAESECGDGKFAGWLKVVRVLTTQLSRGYEVSWDFCCLKCAIEFLKEYEKNNSKD